MKMILHHLPKSSASAVHTLTQVDHTLEKVSAVALRTHDVVCDVLVVVHTVVPVSVVDRNCQSLPHVA